MNDIIKKYFTGLESADYQSTIQLFAEDAIVKSPLYGTVSAQIFYKDLFKDTTQSKITLLNVFSNKNTPSVGAVHFRYDWTMKDGSQTFFECVDIINLSACRRIKELTIIYDTFGTRDAFMKLKA
ncbi:hypothetical protein [Azotosporobacter soli]|uniref:nuclear transport factor 2 family protein n=1 Tax=Azotosporobacter soli TaxID=3055040 RepID=UPI0031FEBCB7